MNQKKAKKLKREAYGRDDPSSAARRYANDPSELKHFRLVRKNGEDTGAIKIETTKPLIADPGRRYYRQLKKVR